MSRAAALAIAALVSLAGGVEARADSAPPAVDLRNFSAVVTAVLDGDTVEVSITAGTAESLGLPPRKSPRPIRLRLYGVDAPEPGQPFGPAARKALSELVLRKEVVVAAVGQEDSGGFVGLVYLDDVEVNELMVKRGNAWASRRNLGRLAEDPRFCLAEREARRGQLGLWQLPTKERRAPWEYRAAKRGEAVRYKDFDGEMAEACVASFESR
jgi:micrococcal nuclease